MACGPPPPENSTARSNFDIRENIGELRAWKGTFMSYLISLLLAIRYAMKLACLLRYGRIAQFIW